MVCNFKGIPDAVHDVGNFLCVAEKIKFRNIKFQVMVQAVIGTIADGENDTVAGNGFFFSVFFNSKCAVFVFLYTGRGNRLYALERKQTFEHFLIGTAKRAVQGEQFIQSLYDGYIFTAFLQPERCFTANETSADNNGILTGIFFAKKDIFCGVDMCIVAQRKYLRGGSV